MKYIIDLFGLPGSGKTTIANDVVKYLHSKNIEVYKLNGKLWESSIKNTFFHKLYVLLLSMKYFKFFVINNVFLFKNKILKKDNFKHNVKLLLYFGELEVALRSRNSIYISDNGLFQTFVSMLFTKYYSRIDMKDIERLLISYKHLSVINKINIFYVKCDYITSYERVILRDKKIRSILTDEESSKKILKWQDDIFNLFLKNFHDICVIDGSREILKLLDQ